MLQCNIFLEPLTRRISLQDHGNQEKTMEYTPYIAAVICIGAVVAFVATLTQWMDRDANKDHELEDTWSTQWPSK